MKRCLYLLAAVLIILFMAGCEPGANHGPDTPGTSDIPSAPDTADSSGDSSPKEVWSSFSYLPAGFNSSDCKLLKLPDRRQSIVPSDKPGGRIVFEDAEKDADSTEASEYDDVSVRNCEGICYTYGGNNTVTYPEIDEKVVDKMFKPETDETVLEWENDKHSYRLFGTVGRDELIKIAEGISGV